MRGDPKLYELLKQLEISFDYYEHPPVPTVEEAAIYWKDIEATHCKNLFFRNHKGNRHYLPDLSALLNESNIGIVNQAHTLKKH